MFYNYPKWWVFGTQNVFTDIMLKQPDDSWVKLSIPFMPCLPSDKELKDYLAADYNMNMILQFCFPYGKGEHNEAESIMQTYKIAAEKRGYTTKIMKKTDDHFLRVYKNGYCLALLTDALALKMELSDKMDIRYSILK